MIVTPADRALDRWIVALLIVATLAVYAPVHRHQFLNYDDDEYVTENAAVRGGLTVAGVVWVFTQPHSATWHPLTGLSHMLDVELFGLRPGAHLVMNAALHALAAVLLFVVLRTMTGARWRSAWVAALFALHPLHVESVAWVSERKDVLSGVFWMLTLWCYARYVRAPTWRRHCALVVVFALGLMAKPMLVTLPFVLLLLDVWPLRRLPLAAASARAALPALVREKLPLLALAVAVSAVTFAVQNRVGAVASFAAVPLRFRVENAIVAYGSYLRKTLWPTDLAVFYPLLPLATWRIVLASAVLIGVSAVVVWQWRRRPYLLVGWLWFLGTLVPVIGLVRQGEQAMADRFTYLPHVGLFIMAAWGTVDLVGTRRRALLAGAGITTAVAAALLSARQLRHWENSVTLFRHALAVTDDNYIAHTNLGVARDKEGARDEATQHYAEALRIKPEYAKAHLNVGVALAARGDVDAAIAEYADALRLAPRLAVAEYNWGLALAERGALDDAIAHYERALADEPRYAKAHNNLGWALAARGDVAAAIDHYRAALALDPNLTAAHNNLAIALEGTGNTDAALAHYSEAVRLAPEDPRARYNLASVLTGAGRGDEAILHYREAVRIAPRFPEARFGLASALAERGNIRDAAAEYREALRLRPDWPEAERALASLAGSEGSAAAGPAAH